MFSILCQLISNKGKKLCYTISRIQVLKVDQVIEVYIKDFFFFFFGRRRFKFLDENSKLDLIQVEGFGVG